MTVQGSLWGLLETPSPQLAALLAGCDHKTMIVTKSRIPVGTVEFSNDCCRVAWWSFDVGPEPMAQADVIRFAFDAPCLENQRSILEIGDTDLARMALVRGWKPLPREAR